VPTGLARVATLPVVAGVGALDKAESRRLCFAVAEVLMATLS
jgi:hypothetical protein